MPILLTCHVKHPGISITYWVSCWLLNKCLRHFPKPMASEFIKKQLDITSISSFIHRKSFTGIRFCWQFLKWKSKTLSTKLAEGPTKCNNNTCWEEGHHFNPLAVTTTITTVTPHCACKTQLDAASQGEFTELCTVQETKNSRGGWRKLRENWKRWMVTDSKHHRWELQCVTQG